MLQFTTVYGKLVFINPRTVLGVEQGDDDKKGCVIVTAGARWTVEGRAEEAQLRIWKVLMKP